MDKYEVLRRCFGYDAFRPKQESIIDGLISGRDVLAVMPTGAGKSICYQIPAMLCEGMTIIVSPLIALMSDQVNTLCGMGVACAYINGTLSPRQMELTLDDVAHGRIKILYVAPERLHNIDFMQAILGLGSKRRAPVNVSMVIVDEAHCVSMWGSAFRPSYQRIDAFVAALPVRPVLGAFTATATAAVSQDIETLLGMREPLRVCTGFDRPNLYFDVRTPEDKLGELVELLRKRRGMCGIVYCLTRSAVDETCEALRHMGINAARYHGGMTMDDRACAQEAFLQGKSSVMVATNAFGMGIDKRDVRFVIHYNMPLNLESYYQEAGRAGRDGEKADCVLLFGENDIAVCKWLIGHSALSSELTGEQAEEFKQRELVKLDKMVAYCRTHECLRKFILNYFGESADGECNWCANCMRYSVINRVSGSKLAQMLRERQRQRAEQAKKSSES